MSQELVTIARFVSVLEAEMARGFLQAHELYVFLADAHTTRIENSLTPILGGIKLQVRRADEDKARGLLSQVNPNVSSAQGEWI